MKDVGGNESTVYVIDNEYRLCYFSDELKESFPYISKGERCYEVLCGESSPCGNCPMNRKSGGNSLFYNKREQRWLEVGIKDIDWPGVGMCKIIMTNLINESNKAMLRNLSSHSVYDEVVEINLTEDTYKVFYHAENKYVHLPKKGRLKNQILDMSENMIHPEDKEAFLEFWNWETLEERLKNTPDMEPLGGEFRRKLAGGGYRWTEQMLILGSEWDEPTITLMCFVSDVHEKRIRALEGKNVVGSRHYERNEMTGLYKEAAFLEKVKEVLDQHDARAYCLLALDIEHFKLFNEWYGEAAGDEFLADMGSLLKESEEYGGFAGYMGADDFCILLPDDEKVVDKLQQSVMNYVNEKNNSMGFAPVIGVYGIEDSEMPISSMYDRAVIALNQVKGNYANRICRFEKEMIQEFEKNYVLLTEVQQALEREEFVFYLQPKCNMSTGKIVGMEALVRWEHPERGMVSPGEFIPLLEKTGFITALDLYVWESVCQWIRSWVDRGFEPVPVSVNVSRIDIYTLDIDKKFQEFIEKYNLQPEWVLIEITESVYSEEYNIITGLVERLRNTGFTVLMDDFGSGYSSLNMLKDVNVDVLKIDMKFINLDGDSVERGQGILEAIIRMARLMELRLVAEGVETAEQRDFLLNMGCLFGQGYYFYRPMKVEQIEKLLANPDVIDSRGMSVRVMKPLQVKDLMNEDNFLRSILDNIVGGIAFYSVKDDQVEIIRVNERYHQIVGSKPIEIKEQRDNILHSLYREDRKQLLSAFEEARVQLSKGAVQEVRRIKDNGGTAWLNIHIFFLREQNDRKIYYAVIKDVTEQKVQEQKLRYSQKALVSLVNTSKKDESFMKLTETSRKIVAAIYAQLAPGGMIGGYCEEDFPIYFCTSEMLELLGYDTYDEFERDIDKKVINTIHPDDRARVARDLGDEYYIGFEYTTTYRTRKKDGTWIWVLDKGEVVEAEDGRLAIVSACVDISEGIAMQQEISEREAQQQS